MDRLLFCLYWLYFNGFRVFVAGGEDARLADFLGITFLVIGFASLLVRKRMRFKILFGVTILFLPLFLAVIVDPSFYVLGQILKLYVTGLYLAFYLDVRPFTKVELICFLIPVFLNLYLFIFPSDWALTQLDKGRLSGISEPNFTSLSLLFSMASALALYKHSKVSSHGLFQSKWSRVSLIAIIIFCLIGIILTASRAGFIGAIIAVAMFLLINNKLEQPFVAVAVAVAALCAVLAFAAPEMGYINNITLLQRFESDANERGTLAEIAWQDIDNGDWFVGGGPNRVSDWAGGGSKIVNVPHNSFLDIGLGFGKACFYFYSALAAVLTFLTLYHLFRYIYTTSRKNVLDSATYFCIICFLSTAPMYLTLSAGMTMGFVFWIIMGRYSFKNLFYSKTRRPFHL